MLPERQGSGGASAPPATVTGGAWVHAPPQKKKKTQQPGVDQLLPLFFPRRPADQTKNTQQLILLHFF